MPVEQELRNRGALEMTKRYLAITLGIAITRMNVMDDTLTRLD
jgi:hypothetical protein